ncbi:MAG: hypothetical protein V4642_10355 [Bacteroidota bacterium]
MKRILPLTLICLVAATSYEATAQALQQSKTTKGNVDLQVTNYGIFGLDVAKNTGGGFWPRGSQNQYIFGGGVWFAALKLKSGEVVPQKLVTISYNPNSGGSWMVPGSIEDGPNIDLTTFKYDIQSSVDYNPDGTAINPPLPTWPMWNTGGDLKKNANFGSYIYNEADRTSAVYPRGAAFISDEDIISIFKDTDKNYYDSLAALQQAFPLGMQYQQAVYSWNKGTPLQDVVVIRYTMINTSQDILRECYLAPAIDADIAVKSNAAAGSANDRTRFMEERPELQTAIQWTNENAGEAGKGFGYLGVTLLETPAVDAENNLRKDKAFYPFTEQIGLHTFRNWTIAIDPLESDLRYAFMSTGVKDGDDGPGDKRMLASTGPFNMMPGDTARVAVALTFAKYSNSAAAGTAASLTELIGKIETLRNALYSGVLSVETENLLKEKGVFISFKNDNATLHFKNDTFKNIRAELFNTLGERVSIIHNGDITANELSFKTAELPAGMYYCVITSNGERITLPMTIVR